MQTPKIRVYHFHNGHGGGVLSVIKNLLLFSSSPLIENHVIHVINKDAVSQYPLQHLQGAVSENIFYYSPRWNFYHTCNRLSKLLPDEKAVIVSHDWIELGMASNLGLPNPVVTFLHGNYDYYYQLAKLHEAVVDKYIVVASVMLKKLQTVLPGREATMRYLRFPVPPVNFVEKIGMVKHIAFVGRLTQEKGYPLLPEIDKRLREKNVCLHWHIVGDNKAEGIVAASWGSKTVVNYHGKMNNSDVLLLLQQMHFFILPSSAEGMPVSLIEAMKAGAIPFVNNLDGGIQELVKDGVTGYTIADNNPEVYAECITKIVGDESLAAQIRMNCIDTANTLFDPANNTRLIEDEICTLFSTAFKNKNPKKIYGSRLDQKWVPNFFTASVRSRKFSFNPSFKLTVKE
jgi:glycosyltransferase involved in cell wall biosynthesis